MKYRICKIFEVENGHMLSKHPDDCKFPHGHSRKIECVLECYSLDSNEMVCDFKLIKEIIGNYIKKYDHAMCMNTNDPLYDKFKKIYDDRVIGYEGEDPTTEILARDIFQYFKESLQKYISNLDSKYILRECVKVHSVKVWETSTSWALCKE